MALNEDSLFSGGNARFSQPTSNGGFADGADPAAEDEDPVIAGMRRAWRDGEFDQTTLPPNLHQLSDSVGQYKPNDRRDVAKVQVALDRAGAYDLIPTDGPTGYFGSSMHRAITDYQRGNGLKVDGVLHPGGETIQSLSSTSAPPDQQLSEEKHNSGATAQPHDRSAVPSLPPPTDQKMEGASEPDTSRLGVRQQRGEGLDDPAGAFGRAFLPAPALTKERLQKFQQSTGYAFAKTQDGTFELRDPRGQALVVLPDEAAAGMVRDWGAYSNRMALLSIAARTDLKAAQKLKVAEPLFPHVGADQFGSTSAAGSAQRAGVQARIEMERRNAEEMRRSFRDAAMAIDIGKAPEEAVAQLRRDILPDLYANLSFPEIAADLMPGLGQLRSARRLADDIAEFSDLGHAGTGKVLGHAGMAALDALGALPAAATVKALPYAKRVIADQKLAQMARQFSDTDHTLSAKNLFGEELWSTFSPVLQNRLGFETNLTLGAAGENYAADLARTVDPGATTGVRIDTQGRIPGVSGRRIYDFEKLKLLDAISQDIAEKYAAFVGRPAPTAASRIQYEAKTAGAEKTVRQERTDEWARSDPDQARSIGINGVEDVRIFPEQIPLEFVMNDAQPRFARLVSRGIIDQNVADTLLAAFDTRFRQGVRTVAAKDYVGFLARLASEGTRAERNSENGAVGSETGTPRRKGATP